MKRKLTFMILAMLFAILGPGAKAWGQTYEFVMELDMTTKAAKCSSYNTTISYGDWKITNGANNNGGWTYFKMGGKNTTILSYNPCYIYYSADSGVSSKVDKITVSIADGSLSKSGMSVNSWGVYVYSDKAMTTQIDYVAGGTITKNAATFDFTPSAGKTWAAGYYYKVSWDLANTTTTNGIVCVDKITLYKASTPSHTLTFSATNGSITASGEDEAEIESGDDVEEGAELNITATADDWYKFSGWNVSGTGSTLGSTTENPTTFTMGTADATLTATFAACVVTVSSNDENWGIALYDDESHTISTAAEDGYRISTTEPYTIVPADAATLTAGDGDTFVVSGVKDQDVEITINFEALPSVAYTVTFNAGTNGTCSTTELTEAEAGAGVTLPDCTPNAGYQFVGWATSETATEAEYEGGATYYPTANITLYAVYNEVYTINYMVNGTNTGAQENVVKGTPLVFPNVTAPDADHVFRGWVTEAIEGTTDTEPAYVNTTDLTATQNITYYAVFAEKEGGEESESLACPKGTISNNTMTFNTTNFVIVHAKGTSSNFAEYSPWRIYKNNTVTVSSNSKTISKLEMVTDGTYYGTWTTTAGTVNVATTSGGTTSVTGINAKEVTLENIDSAARWSNIAIYYDETSYSNFCTTVVTKILTSISLSGEYPTEFWKGETFSHEGMIVTAHYNDGSTKDVTSSATFSTPNMTTVGEQTVTVTYDTKSTTYSITVKNIANTQETAYTVTEAKSLIDANPAGLEATEVYVKGTVSKVDGINDGAITYWLDNNTFEVYKGKNVGDEAFTNVNQISVNDDVIIYGKIKKYYSTYEFDSGNYLVSHVKVATLSINDITVSLGEEISPEITTNVPEAERTITYSVASENVVKVDEDGKLVTVAVGGPVTVTATLTADGYKEATTTFTVEVIKALTSIEIETPPTTTSYKVGDFFNPAGLVITANYNDESTEDVAYAGNEDKFTFDPSLETELTTNITIVTITYAGKTTTQTITVRELHTYYITWKANGEQFTITQVTEDNTLALPETNPDNIGDMIFQGWINTENYYHAETAPEYIVPDKIIPTEAMTFYAVYAKESAGETTSVTKDIIDEAGLTTSVTLNTDNNPYQMGELPITLTGIKGTSNFPALNYNATNGTDLRFYKGTTCGVTFATTNNSTITKIEFKKNAETPSTLGDAFSANVGTLSGNVWTGNAKSVIISYSAGATFKEQMYIINVTYSETSPSIYSNFCTTVKPIEEDKTIFDNAFWEGNITIDEHTVTISSGAVLTVNGALINTDPEKLIIKEGGQLIVNNKGVQATMEKNIDNTSRASDVKWYTISSPLAASVNVTDVTNLIPTTVTATDYDLYYLDEAIGMWINSRIHGDDDDYPVIANPDFTTIDKGRGYIYSNTTAADIAFAGEVNVADVECNLTIGAANGFNLIGNPFTQNIELANVAGVTLAEGFYVLNNDNTWRAKRTDSEDSEIKPLQGFLVQATEEGGTARISKNASVRGERSKEQSTNIEMIVSNSTYRDNAFAMFGEGTGLNKVNHRNAQAPMLYVPQDGEDFAIAFMDENTTLFPLNFKAMTTGNYSITLKPTDDINTLVLVDNMTGVETNMLFEGSYSFIGSPADNDSRFTVKLSISHNDGQADSEHFVYQNGSELVINGEGTLQIFDVLGRVVISEEVHGQTVNVGGLSTGAYIVRLTGESVKTQKIVVR